jgi:hypothetical protein
MKNNCDYSNEPDHQFATKQKVAELQGTIRALMTLLIEMPEITTQAIDAAKNTLRNQELNSRDQHIRDYAKLKVRMNLPIDEHAEAALDEQSMSDLKNK